MQEEWEQGYFILFFKESGYFLNVKTVSIEYKLVI